MVSRAEEAREVTAKRLTLAAAYLQHQDVTSTLQRELVTNIEALDMRRLLMRYKTQCQPDAEKPNVQQQPQIDEQVIREIEILQLAQSIARRSAKLLEATPFYHPTGDQVAILRTNLRRFMHLVVPLTADDRSDREVAVKARLQGVLAGISDAHADIHTNQFDHEKTARLIGPAIQRVYSLSDLSI